MIPVHEFLGYVKAHLRFKRTRGFDFLDKSLQFFNCENTFRKMDPQSLQVERCEASTFGLGRNNGGFE
jgi:hypothetical protein